MSKFKKHNWLRYGRQGNKVEISIFDESDRKMDFFRTNNSVDLKRITKICKDKYGIDFTPEIKTEESINYKGILEKDMNW